MQYLFIGMKQYIDEQICPVCGVDCKYPSKLKRHLQSAKHQLYEASLCASEVQNEDDVDGSYSSPTEV